MTFLGAVSANKFVTCRMPEYVARNSLLAKSGVSRRKQLNILALLLYWYPYSGPMTPIYAGIFRDLKAKGHKVTIISSFPHFRSGSNETWDGFRGKLYEKTSWEDMDLIRTWVFAPVFKDNRFALLFRAINFISFTLTSLVAGLCLRTKFDVVLTLSSPPLVNALVGWVVSRRIGAKSIHNIVDIYPDMIQKVGLWNNKPVMYLLRGVERLVYKVSDKLIVLSEDMKDNLIGKGVDEQKIDVIPGFIDIEGVFPQPRDNIFSKKYDLLNHTIILYAGNIGIPHGVEVLIDTAELMQEDKDVLFCIVGRGENRDKIISMTKQQGLQNVRFIPRQPEEMVPYIWSSAGISIVTYKRGLSEYSVPSKLLYIMASQRPVIVTSDNGTYVSRLVNEAECGVIVEPEDAYSLRDAIVYLKDNPEVMKEFGINGHEYAKKHFDRQVVSSQFEDLFLRMTYNC